MFTKLQATVAIVHNFPFFIHNLLKKKVDDRLQTISMVLWTPSRVETAITFVGSSQTIIKYKKKKPATTNQSTNNGIRKKRNNFNSEVFLVEEDRGETKMRTAHVYTKKRRNI